MKLTISLAGFIEKILLEYELHLIGFSNLLVHNWTQWYEEGSDLTASSGLLGTAGLSL